MSAYPTPASIRSRRAKLLAGCAFAAAATAPATAQTAFKADISATQGGVSSVVTTTIGPGQLRDTITIGSTQALIDWTPQDNSGTGTINILPAGNELRFQVTNANFVPRYTVLNRINAANPNRPVQFDGLVNSLVDTGYGIGDASIWFYSPGGIIASSTSRFNVHSLLLTSNELLIGNFDSEGLYAGEGTSVTSGTIRFRGVADGRSFVTIQSGAQINATTNQSGLDANYVALVAPRITQNGTVNVNGGIAYVAAEQLDMFIPMSGGLFDVQVQVGTSVDTAGETVLAHGGVTDGTAGAQSFLDRRVHVMAVPKNDAVTMLVAGQLGYAPAAQAEFINGQVVLSTGARISPGSVETPTTASEVRVTGGDFTSSTVIASQTINVDASTADLNVSGYLDLLSPSGPIALSSGSGRSVAIAGALSLGHSAGKADGSSSMSVTANAGTSITAFGIAFSSNSFGLNDSGYGGTSATGGSVSILAEGGTIDAGAGGISVLAIGQGGSSSLFSGGVAGNGKGGTVTVSANGGSILGALSIDARGLGGLESGYGSVQAGAGFGGTVTIATNSGSIKGGSLSADASGEGRFGGTSGGSGTGGAISFSATSGTIDIAGDLTLTARGEGGSSNKTAGFGQGGTVELLATGGTVNASKLTVNAFSIGGDAGYGVSAGSGAGGGIIFELDDTSAASASLIQLFAGASGGFSSSGRAGDATAGTITVAAGAGTFSFDKLEALANGSAGNGLLGSIGGGRGGAVTVSLTGTKAPGANALRLEANGQGSEGDVGSSGRGGDVSFTVAGTSFVTGGDIELAAKGIGDFGNDGGGDGIGGDIILTADNATVQAANIYADASGFGEVAFSDGSGGAGAGGTIAFTSLGGSLIKGTNTLQADGRAGDGFGSAIAGFGQGGTISLLAQGGAFDSSGGTLRIYADGTGGNAAPGISSFGPGGTLLAQGGTIDIDVSGSGQLLLSALEARANGGFNDLENGEGGPFVASPNHGGNGVGGTTRLTLSSGTVSASAITLTADGSGGVSAAGGVGGNGYQGRAEVSLTGGTLTSLSLNVNARATGGDGYFQDSEADTEAGGGGNANTDTSPFVGSAGAIVDVTGGLLDVSIVSLNASGTGGFGGQGSEFAIEPRPREGGVGQGGLATFTVSHGGSVTSSFVQVKASGTGGTGGSAFIGESSESGAIAGDGGMGIGGQASSTLGGTGTISISGMQGFADAFGGDGGGICAFFCSPIEGAGRGGRGGDASGGGVNVTINDAIKDFAFVSIDASAQGGNGGTGPGGGDGGAGTAGNATIAVLSGTTRFSGFQAYSDGIGGDGGDGLGGNAGSGGAATGTNATLTIGETADVSADFLQFFATAQGGFGGTGGDGVSVGYNGGNGGEATGGNAAITVNGGALTLFGSGEGSPAQITVAAFGGSGGSGGSASEGTAGSGGNGGASTGGIAQLSSGNGSIDFFATTMLADASGGSQGSAGDGFGGSDGLVGTADAGAIRIDVVGFGTKQTALGAADLSAAASGSGLQSATFRPVTIAASGDNADGALLFDSLSLVSTAQSNDNAFSVRLDADGTAIKIASGVTIDVAVPVNMLIFDGGVESGGSFELTTQGDWFLSGNGYVKAASITASTGLSLSQLGNNLLQANDFIDLNVGTFAFLPVMQAGSSIQVNAGGPISTIGFTGVDVTLRSGTIYPEVEDRNISIAGTNSVGSNLLIDSSGDIEVFSGALLELGGDSSTFATFRSADDIIIGSGAIIRGVSGVAPETGYGGPSLELQAGFNSRSDFGPNDIPSIIINGELDTGDRTVQLFAETVAAAPTSVITAGNLYVSLNNVPEGDAVPSTDNGQLTGSCIQGAVCLGTVNVTGAFGIGDSFFSSLPQLIQLNGGTGPSASVVLRGGTVRIGQAGQTFALGGTETLVLESYDGSLQLLGNLNLTGGTEVGRLAATGNISGAANVTTAGTLDLYAGNNLSLGAVSAAGIRTIDFEGTVLNASGITVPGAINIGQITLNQNLSLLAGTGVALGTAVLGSATTLNLVTTSGLAGLNGGTAGTINLEGDSIALSVAATGPVTALANTGSATLGTVSGSSIDVEAATGISFTSLTTPGLLALTSAGVITGGSATAASIDIDSDAGFMGDALTATSGAIDVAAATGITLASLSSAGATVLSAASGAISVTTNASSTGGITATARSVNLTSATGLNVTSATATAGNLSLTSATGTLAVGTSSATGAATLTSGGAITFTQLTAGTTLTLNATGAITGGSATAANIAATSKAAFSADSLTASSGTLDVNAAGAITLASLSSANLATLASTGGKVSVTNILSAPAGVTASGTGVALSGVSGLKVNQATATGGDVQLSTQAGPLSVANASATGLLGITSATGLTFGSLSSGGAMTITAAGPVTGTDATGASLALATTGAVDAGQLKTTSGALSVNAAAITLDRIASAGTATLAATTGAVKVVTDAVALGGITATGTSVALTGQTGLNVTKATASSGDLSLASKSGTLAAGTSSATGTLALTSGGGVTFTKLTGGSLIAINAAGNVAGGSASAGLITADAGGILNAMSLIAASGDVDLSAFGGISVASLTAAATAVLQADGGAINVADVAAPNVVAFGKSVTLASGGDLSVGIAKASAGSVALSASDALTVQFAEASEDITFIAASVGFNTISAGGALTVASAGDVVGSSAISGTAQIEVAGLASIDSLAAAGDVSIKGAAGVTLFNLTAGGRADLESSGGQVSVLTDADAASLFATGTVVDLTGTDGLRVDQAVATAGAVRLRTVAGLLDVGTAAASDSVFLTGGGQTQFDSLTAANKVSVTSVGALTGGSIDTGFVGIVGQDDVTLTGTVNASADISMSAGVDFTVASGAKVLAGGELLIAANDDLRIGAGAVLSAARTAGPSSADPLLQPAQLRLIANADLITSPNTVGALIIGSGAVLEGRTVNITGEAIQAAADSNIKANYLFAGLNNTASLSEPALDDGGALLAACAKGNICLGGLSLTQGIEVGAVGFTPNRLTLAGPVSAGTVLLRSNDTLALSGAVTAVTRLAIQSVFGDVVLGDGVTVQASSGPLSLVAARDIIADQATVLGSDVGLSAGRDASFGTLSATALRGADGSGVNTKLAPLGGVRNLTVTKALTVTGAPIDLTATGTINLASVAASSVSLTSEGGAVTIGSLALSAPATESVISGATGVTIAAVESPALLKLASSDGAVTATGTAPLAMFEATGKSVSLTGTGALTATAIATGGDLTLVSLGGDLDATGVATVATSLTSANQISFDSLTSGGTLTLIAGGDIAGGNATAASIAVTTPGSLVADDFVATAGTITAIASKGVSLDTAISSGVTTLKADQGTVLVASDIRPGEGLVVAAPTINLTGQNGLNIAQATATSGDLILKTIAGDLVAGNSSAAGAISLDSAGALSFTALTAQQGVTLKAVNDIAGGAVTGTSLTATAGGSAGLALQSIAVNGPIVLNAAAGAIQVASLTGTGAIEAAARSLSFTTAGALQVTKGTASDGDFLISAGGGVTLGQASATKALTVGAGGTLTLTGTAQAATIGFTSADIVLGSSAQLGSASQTGSITLTSTAPRTFIGGTGTGTGYNLDAGELTRIFARDSFTITTAPVASSAAFSLVKPASGRMVLDNLSFTGAQLGSNGVFTVDSPTSIGIVGNVQYKNFAAGQSVIYRAGGDISLGAETGLVTLKDSAGALAGTLRLQAPRVTAMSVPARAEIPDLTLNQAQQRLGTNDAVQNDGGYFQAGNIVVRIGQFLFIQNSGGNNGVDQRRGFTANSATIEATGPGLAQVAINGSVNGRVGSALPGAITLIGNFDPDSSFSGCGASDSSCGGPPSSVTNMVFSVARDQIRDDQEDDEQEEALQAAQSRPDPVIQIMTAPSSRFDPLIDEPITGAGNEDLWESPTIPSPGK